MFLNDHPFWPAYKAALARLCRAACRLEEAQTLGSLDLCQADREFQEALAEYAAARARLTEQGASSYDGVPAPVVWLGPPMAIPTTASTLDEAAGPEAG